MSNEINPREQQAELAADEPLTRAEGVPPLAPVAATNGAPAPSADEAPAQDAPADEGAPVTVDVTAPGESEAPTAAPPPKRRAEPGEGPFGMLQSLSVTIVIAIFVITFLVQAFQIPSQSMENTLLIGDYLLVDKVHFSPGGAWERVLPYKQVERGDIIVFRYPSNPEQHFVKRVVGLPGDRIRMVNKRVLVNGRPLLESYAIFKSPPNDQFRDNFPSLRSSTYIDGKWWTELQQRVHGGELVVPARSYFVLGDNRDESLDSRYWGFVPRENIIGRPMLIYLSVSAPNLPEEQASDDKLARLKYVLRNLSQLARWERTFRVVR